MDISPTPSGSEVNKGLEGDKNSCGIRVAGMPLSAIAFLILSAAIAIIRSHYQVLWGDEFGFGLLGFDRSSTLAKLIHVQLTVPLSLDPIGYNVLMYSIIRVFGTGEFVLRVPAIAGYLVMQICLFYFVRRIADERSATFALAIPALAGTVGYSFLSRPYGLLPGLLMLAMLCWQTAARRDSQRTLALVGLAFCMAMAVNTQYYSLLFFIPLCAAESTRALERRRLDIAMAVSILMGMTGLLIGLPFVKALAPFRAFHTVRDGIDIHFVSHAYLWLVVGYVALSEHAQHLIGFVSALVLLMLLAGFVRFRSRVDYDFRIPKRSSSFWFARSRFWSFF